ncbi:MAG: hypothetical protein RLP15_02030 [Cryomorphaceae bacterium]
MNFRISLLLVSVVLSMSVPTFGQDTTAVESFEVLEISGVISVDDDGVEDALVELFEGNRVVDAFETKKNGKFKFTLFSNMVYTIQINKQGYYTKRISISTKVPVDFEGFEKFQFDVGLTAKDIEKYDPALAEYPSALIAFDTKKQAFNFDKDYTKTYFDEIRLSDK